MSDLLQINYNEHETLLLKYINMFESMQKMLADMNLIGLKLNEYYSESNVKIRILQQETGFNTYSLKLSDLTVLTEIAKQLIEDTHFKMEELDNFTAKLMLNAHFKINGLMSSGDPGEAEYFDNAIAIVKEDINNRRNEELAFQAAELNAEAKLAIFDMKQEM